MGIFPEHREQTIDMEKMENNNDLKVLKKKVRIVIILWLMTYELYLLHV